MRQIYAPPPRQTVEAAFADFDERWGPVYPAMINAWEASSPAFVLFLEDSSELRAICRAVRHTKVPNERPAMKVLYLVATRMEAILNTLHFYHGDRITRAAQ